MIKYWADRKRIDIFCYFPVHGREYFPDCEGEKYDILLYRSWREGPPSLVFDSKVDLLKKAGLFRISNVRINMNFLDKGFII